MPNRKPDKLGFVPQDAEVERDLGDRGGPAPGAENNPDNQNKQH